MKKYRNILFDLDGTLLPIDYEKFLYIYMKDLAEKFSKEGFEGKKIIQAVMKSTAAIMNNDGKMTNCQAFWQNLSELTDLQRDEIEPIFESYYENEYDAAALPSKKNPPAEKMLLQLQRKGYRLFLATAPYFPKLAIEKRLQWAGLDSKYFEYITTYDTCCYCKPNWRYYKEILDKFHLEPEETLMVGNDAEQDTPCQDAGIDCWLITDHLINEKNLPLNSKYCSDFNSFCQKVECEF